MRASLQSQSSFPELQTNPEGTQASSGGNGMMAPCSQARLEHQLNSVVWTFDHERNYRCLECSKTCVFMFTPICLFICSPQSPHSIMCRGRTSSLSSETKMIEERSHPPGTQSLQNLESLESLSKNAIPGLPPRRTGLEALWLGH